MTMRIETRSALILLATLLIGGLVIVESSSGSGAMSPGAALRVRGALRWGLVPALFVLPVALVGAIDSSPPDVGCKLSPSASSLSWVEAARYVQRAA